jgi:hypothetical protein
MTDPSPSFESLRSGKAAEYYRDKLVDWMINQDIPTGENGQSFEDLLEVIGTYIRELKKQRENYEE